MKSKWGRMDILLLLIGLLPVVGGLVLYDRLPSQVAIHFSLNNAPNGWMSKPMAVLMLGLLSVGVPPLMKVMGQFDPKRENYSKFLPTFDLIRLAVALLLVVVSGFVLLFNIGVDVPADRIAMLVVGAIFALMGNYMGRIRHNFTLGIRTPWTLASEDVWRRTHRFAGPIWLAGGLLMIIIGFLPGQVFAVGGLVVLGLLVVLPVAYSFVIYQKLCR